MGSGTMTPSVSSAYGTVSALPYTALSLDRYAKILGINPVHFWRAYGESVFPVDQSCNDIWVRHSWQASDRTSHEELLRAIHTAEEDISRAIGYPVAPRFIAGETHEYTRYHRRDMQAISGYNIHGKRKSNKLRWMKLIEVGRRAVTAIMESAVVVYADADGDGLFETATLTVATTETSVCGIKVYHDGKNGDPRWEIRHPRSMSISGGTLTIVLDSWLLIKPEVLGEYPTVIGGSGNPEGGVAAIDIEGDTTQFVDTVDIYKEYADTTQNSIEYRWEPDADCLGADCVDTVQGGCLFARDYDAGIVASSPATYDGGWTNQPFSVGREPDTVKLWYVAGEESEEYRNGWTCDPLSDYWAETIAMLATARLEHEFCGCGKAAEMAEHWRIDIARMGEEVSYAVDFNSGLLSNPFGTRVGEIRAWQRTARFRNSYMDSVLL